ncbi:MAG TPA: type II secretion system protein [Armatimonadota bacterium]|jgi:prepilin-type N-terminal cleavage/methylation domain-containing protein
MRIRAALRAFTLIEMLVVITIIAILAGLLMPVFNTVRVKQRENTCIANLHALGVALKQYQADNHAYPLWPWYDGNRYQGGFSALFPEFVTDKNLFICPDDEDGRKDMEAAKSRVYCTYNGVIDPATWQFVILNGHPERLYNYFGYTADGFDLYTPPAGDNPYPMPGPPSNSPLPAWLVSQGLSWRFYPRLVNRYAPDNTIVTHCPHHRTHYGDASRAMDPVLRLNGEAKKVVASSMYTPDSSGFAPWVTQK